MTLIGSIAVFPRVGAMTKRRPTPVAPPRPPVSGTATAQAPRKSLRARWSIDPASGRLQCRWTAEDEGADSPGDRRLGPETRASMRPPLAA